MPNFIPLEKVEQIRRLDAAGASTRVIAAEVGVSKITVTRYLNKNADAIALERELPRPVDIAHRERHQNRFAQAPDLSDPIYNSPQAAFHEIIRRRWSDGKMRCIKCEHDRLYHCARNNYKCASCGHVFAITSLLCVGRAKLPLTIYLRLERIARDGVLSMQQAAHLAGVTHKSAHEIVHKIRANGGKLV